MECDREKQISSYEDFCNSVQIGNLAVQQVIEIHDAAIFDCWCRIWNDWSSKTDEEKIKCSKRACNKSSRRGQ
jgi:hypothetical protein